MGETMEDGISKGAKLKVSLENTEQILSSQIKSLEILTNICCACDDPDSEEYYDTESCSEGTNDGEGLQEGQFELHPELRQAFLEAKIFNLLIEKAKLPAENIVEALRQHPLGKTLLSIHKTYVKLMLFNRTRIDETVRNSSMQSFPVSQQLGHSLQR